MMKLSNKVKAFGLVIAMMGVSLLSSAQANGPKLSDEDRAKVDGIKSSYQEKIAGKQLEVRQYEAELYVLLLADKNNSSKAQTLVEKLVDARFSWRNMQADMMRKINAEVPSARLAMSHPSSRGQFAESHGNPPVKGDAPCGRFDGGNKDECNNENRAKQEMAELPRIKKGVQGYTRGIQGEPRGVQLRTQESDAVKEIKAKYQAERKDLISAQFSEEKRKAMQEEQKAMQKQMKVLEIKEYYEILNALPEAEQVQYKIAQAQRIAIESHVSQGGRDKALWMGQRMENEKARRFQAQQ
ncbi:MAG: hypothetical protein ACK5JS_02235 [Mangrovibacterium sp.]